MKKLIIISLMLSVIIACGVAECLFTEMYYNGIADELERAQSLILEDKYDEAGEIITDVIADFDGMKTVIYLLNNHNVAHNVYERVINANEYLKEGEKSDALAYLSSAIFLAREIVRDTLPDISNIL